MSEQRWNVDGPTTIEVDDITAIEIGLIGGRIDVVAHDDPEVRVEVHRVDAQPLEITQSGSMLRIRHPQLEWGNPMRSLQQFLGRHPVADLSVLVPREIDLRLGLVSASGLVSGIRRGTNLSTVSGDLVADSIAGPLSVNSVSGEIVVRDHSGTVDANTVSGGITATGAIPRIWINGVSSDVVFDSSVAVDEITVNTVSGGVTARIPDRGQHSYVFSTLSGRLQIDGTDIPKPRPFGAYSGTTGTGDMRGQIAVNTVSGGLQLLHGPAPELP